MYKISHTPGPWLYKQDGLRITIGNESTRHAYLKHDYTVAVIHDNSMKAVADARLIAKAPTLLMCLQQAVLHIERMNLTATSEARTPNIELDIYNAAITEAEG